MKKRSKPIIYTILCGIILLAAGCTPSGAVRPDPADLSFRDRVAISGDCVAAVKKDGTVCGTYVLDKMFVESGLMDIAAESEEETEKINTWKDIREIDAGWGLVVGLTEGGTVMGTGINRDGYQNLENLSGVKQIDICYDTAVALMEDGTVRNGGKEIWPALQEWQDITEISCGLDDVVAGLKEDGTVVYGCSCPEGKERELHQRIRNEVQKWEGITQVACGTHSVLGLKEDGTVIAAGDNQFGECAVEGWTDVVQIIGGDYRNFGIRSDGTVLVTDWETAAEKLEIDSDISAVYDWQDIIVLKDSGSLIMGITADGRLCFADNTQDSRIEAAKKVLSKIEWS